MDDSDDSDVILIDSDDNDCRSRKGRSTTSNCYSNKQHQKKANHTIDIESKDIECIDLDNSDNNKSCSSSSSSSSSGIPSPLFRTKSSTSVHKPPSIIHTKSVSDSNNTAAAQKKGLSNGNQEIYKEDDMMSCCYTDMSTTTSSISNEDTLLEGKKSQSKQQQSKPKKRQWNNRKRSTTKKPSDTTNIDTSLAGTTSSETAITISKTTKKKKPTSNTNEATSKHFHCYLLRSMNPDHPYKTYIGFTTHPQRRIRQHNGILKAGGARRTKRAGRPWTFVCVIHGFQDKITALQFEWAWQNVDKSKAFREAVGDDKLAKKMKRRYGPKARLEELRILLKECLPFCLYSLTVYFPEKEYHDIFSGILRRGKNGNPYKKDDDEDCNQSELYEPLMNIEVCSLENMPMAKEIAALKEKKQAKREAAKALKQQQKKQQKKKGKKKVASSTSSDWQSDENAKDDVESCWTDLIEEDYDDKEETSNNLDTIQEREYSSINLCDNDSSSLNSDDDGSLRSESSSNHEMSHDGVDAISKDLFSLSMGDASKKKHASIPRAPNKQSRDTDECDFSTISSKSADDSDCCLDDVCGGSTINSSTTKRWEKENEPVSSSSNNKKSASMIFIATGSSSMSDVVDLCDSP